MSWKNAEKVIVWGVIGAMAFPTTGCEAEDPSTDGTVWAGGKEDCLVSGDLWFVIVIEVAGLLWGVWELIDYATTPDGEEVAKETHEELKKLNETEIGSPQELSRVVRRLGDMRDRVLQASADGGFDTLEGQKKVQALCNEINKTILKIIEIWEAKNNPGEPNGEPKAGECGEERRDGDDAWLEDAYVMVVGAALAAHQGLPGYTEWDVPAYETTGSDYGFEEAEEEEGFGWTDGTDDVAVDSDEPLDAGCGIWGFVLNCLKAARKAIADIFTDPKAVKKLKGMGTLEELKDTAAALDNQIEILEAVVKSGGTPPNPKALRDAIEQLKNTVLNSDGLGIDKVDDAAEALGDAMSKIDFPDFYGDDCL